jgi:hypothetical protein
MSGSRGERHRFVSRSPPGRHEIGGQDRQPRVHQTPPGQARHRLHETETRPHEAQREKQDALEPGERVSEARHPIYLGLALLATGEALAVGSWPALTIVLSGIIPTFAWRARAEEKLLSRTFGDRYTLYRQRINIFSKSCPTTLDTITFAPCIQRQGATDYSPSQRIYSR